MITPTGMHPDAAQIAAFIDRRVSPADRAALAEHLIACDECRTSVADVSRVARIELTRKRGFAAAAAMTGIAAALVLLALPRDAALSNSTSAPIERTGAVPGAGPIRVWSPDSRSAVSGAPLAFAWSAVVSGAQYRVTLTDAAGDEIWTRSTADTTLTLPASLELAREREYFWVVDALLPDGETVTSGIRQLPQHR